MITRADVRRQIQLHQDGALTLEDLSAWAEQAFREEGFDPPDAERIATVLAVLRDATDPHRFRWEEPDFEGLVRDLET